jgi:predicted ArsR family transcriptional regulator
MSLRVNICIIRSNRIEIQQRREKLWTLLARGNKRLERAKELGIDPTTVSRDIAYLVAQSQTYLSDLAKGTLPFMYQTAIEGIRSVMKECWNIYERDEGKDKLAALKLIKECHEAVFKLVDEGPSVMYLKLLQEKLISINENRQVH